MLTLTPFAGFLVALALAFALTPVARRLSVRFGAMDRPSVRKLHSRDMPRLGGVAIATGFYVPVLVLAFRVNLFSHALYQQPARVAVLLGGGLVILGLGVVDDLRGTSAVEKLAVQVPVAAIAWWAGVRIDGASGPEGGFLAFAPGASFAATVLWIVLVTNAINLIDGLDGLASGIALQALLATAFCAWYRGDPVLVLIALCLSGAVAGFLFHNFHPASIYMGDSGSMFLGYVVALAAAWSSQKAATTVALVVPALAVGLPLLDTTLAVWRRLSSGRPMMQGDLDHVHHRLLARVRSPMRSVLVLYAVGLFFSGISVALVLLGDRRLSWPLVGVALAAAIGFSIFLARGGRAGAAPGGEADASTEEDADALMARPGDARRRARRRRAPGGRGGPRIPRA